MKKLIAFALIVVAVLSAGDAVADDGGKMTFDSVTFGKAYKIKGYASINLLGFKFINMFAQWEDRKASANLISANLGFGILNESTNLVYSHKKYYYYFSDCQWRESGTEAEFAWLKADVTNLQKTEDSFMNDITVKVIYDDEYEYDGWIRQFNYDYSKSEVYRYKETSVIGWPVCLSPVDEMSISPMYKGHYAFGCTLPNFVVEDKESPLRMIITIGGNTLTYNIR